MATQTHPSLRVIFYEGSGAMPLTQVIRNQAVSGLLDRGYSVSMARKSPDKKEGTPVTENVLLVLGAFSGDFPQLEDQNGLLKVEVRDIVDKSAEEIVQVVEGFRQTQEKPMNQPGQWKPWFPVIDYDRCTNCMQCLSFCLFDVYGVSSQGKIQVQNNDNCKTNCPACSRVCPEVAIMFPKYQSGPINGEVVNTDDVRREKMKVDISSLLGGDIYARLKDRSVAAKSRFSKERSSDKALDERKKCLVKLAGDGFIPAEVLANLPSPDEIARKAEEAAEKARAALAMQAN